MTSVPQYRQFAYALLATLVALRGWMEWGQSYDGGWILWASVALFGILLALDWLLTRLSRDDDLATGLGG